MKPTYLFYDLETSGLSPCFDQVYQFAGIRTDLDLNEIERYDFLVKPTIDIIPTPEAMITHRLSIDQLQLEGESEDQVIYKIHQLLNEPGTISLGYNTLTFDDEFLRFNFYRHLLPPYTHQFANQCRRMDLFPMAVFYWLFRRDHLQWGERNDKLSLKLEDLSQKNQLSIGQAHNAIVDVEATINLARKLKEDAKMWDYLTAFFLKEKDSIRLGELPLVEINHVAYPYGLAVNGKFGGAQSFQVPVVGLGQHWHYKNQTLWLKLDDERLLTGDLALIPELWTIKKRCAEPPFIIQPKEQFNKIGMDRKALMAETLKFLQSNPKYFTAIQTYALDFKFPVYPETDRDAALYSGGFWSDSDVASMQSFWQADPTQKLHLTERLRPGRLQNLAARFLGRFHQELLSTEARSEFTAYVEKIWNGEPGGVLDYQLNPRLTRHEALTRIQALEQTELDGQQREILSGLKASLK